MPLPETRTAHQAVAECLTPGTLGPGEGFGGARAGPLFAGSRSARRRVSETTAQAWPVIYGAFRSSVPRAAEPIAGLALGERCHDGDPEAKLDDPGWNATPQGTETEKDHERCKDDRGDPRPATGPGEAQRADENADDRYRRAQRSTRPRRTCNRPGDHRPERDEPCGDISQHSCGTHRSRHGRLGHGIRLVGTRGVQRRALLGVGRYVPARLILIRHIQQNTL